MSSNGNSMAVVLFKEPQGPTHLNTMFGRFIATLSGILYYPYGVLRRYAELNIFDFEEYESLDDESDWHLLENARKFLHYTKSFTPHVLFRGFTPDSGGGGDSRLNGPCGIIPHGFLGGKMPTSMWDTSGLFNMISGHIGQDPEVVTDFSSWSQEWGTAIQYSRYPHRSDAMMAVFETTSAEEHVWHTGDLVRADLAEPEDVYLDEYLVYGPVTGSKYHCISPRTLYGTTRIRDLLGEDESVFGGNSGGGLIEHGAVLSAMDVAAVLQPRGARGETLAVLTARFMSYRIAFLSQSHRRWLLSYVDMRTYLHHVRYQIQCMAMHAKDGEALLVDNTMVAATRCLRFEVQLLQAVQNTVRLKAYDMRATMWEICRLRHMDELRLEDAMDQAESDDEKAQALISVIIRSG